MAFMNKTHVVLSFLFAPAFILPPAALAQLSVVISGGFAAPYQELLPGFEKTSGITVTTKRGASQGSGPSTIPTQLRSGVAVDVVIMSKEGLHTLIDEGRILPGSAVDLAQSPLGVAVRTGAAKPDINTVEGFKQALLQAKSINAVSTTGLYLTERLLPKLGIATEVSRKIKGSTVGDIVSGEVEIAIRPVSEIVNVPGVDFVGPIPEEIQFVSVFTAAIVAGSNQTDAAKRLIGFLATEDARPAIRRSGMEPIRSR
jgi:molybdate transport system substrate-binding protein